MIRDETRRFDTFCSEGLSRLVTHLKVGEELSKTHEKFCLCFTMYKRTKLITSMNKSSELFAMKKHSLSYTAPYKRSYVKAHETIQLSGKDLEICS